MSRRGGRRKGATDGVKGTPRAHHASAEKRPEKLEEARLEEARLQEELLPEKHRAATREALPVRGWLLMESDGGQATFEQ